MSDKLSQVYGYMHVASGTRRHVDVDISLLYRDALLLGASGIFAVHNHPSGDPRVTDADRTLTRRLCLAGETLGIDVNDHFIHMPDGAVHSIRAQCPDIWPR